ncbi:pentapeptide repeat-containing protein [Yersinia frederiksenii]|nr:pentapeptide repeat-containing protein [Yersinia frederiksenii]
MNLTDLNKILGEHKIWVESYRENGSRADLSGADLSGAYLPDLTFVLMGWAYPVFITNGEYVRAGCQSHTAEEWRKFSKLDIAGMDCDARKALKFYPRLLDIIDFHLGNGDRPEWLNEPDEEAAA